jgi:tRNA pseudouridine38-40 synthase
MEKVPMAMHAMLPEDIRVAAASEVPDDFSPRFDAIRRAYCYRLVVREHPSPLNRRHVARYAHRVEPALLQAAAAAFVGRWELREWRASICQAKRTLLTIERCEAELPTAELPYYRIHVEARSFLHHQVRLREGGIVAVASEKLSLEELQTALAAGKRPAVVENMPPCGLTMTRVDFPPEKHPFGSLAP